MKDVQNEIEMNAVLGNTAHGTYDSDRESIDCTGPKGLHRAVIAEQVKGREVTGIRAFSFDINDQGALKAGKPSEFSPPPRLQALESDKGPQRTREHGPVTTKR
jgi:hypothetical protein